MIFFKNLLNNLLMSFFAALIPTASVATYFKKEIKTHMTIFFIYLGSILLCLISSLIIQLIWNYYFSNNALKNKIQANEKDKKSKIRYNIPHINATYDESFIAHCKECDAIMISKVDPILLIKNFFHFCPKCDLFRHSFDEKGWLITELVAKQIAMDHLNNS